MSCAVIKLHNFLNPVLFARRCLAMLLLALLLAPGISAAQSGCTAMWGITTTGGAQPFRLGYFNNSTGTASKFTTLSFTLTGNANALAGDPATGLLYYFDRTGLNLYSVDLNTQGTTTVGAIAPASPNGNTLIIGAYVDPSSNLILMSSSGAAGGNYQLATVSKTGPTTNAVWQTVTYTIGGGIVSSGGSGDIFLDSATGRRLGTEAKFSSDWFKDQQVIFGVSYRNDYQRRQVNAALASNQGRQSASVYAQDEITLNHNLWLNVGVRYDYFTDDGNSISPRIALI